LKSYFSDPFGRWLILGSFFLAVVVGIGGFLVNPQGFLENLLSEATGIFAGILIALLIVDKYAEYHKERQWSRVRRLTYNSIRAHLCDLATDVIINFLSDHRLMTPIIDGRDYPNPKTTTAMKRMVAQLRELSDTVGSEKSTSDLAVEWYEEVKWDLDQIQHLLTPRVVQSSNDQQVIDSLIEFDNARRSLHNAIILHQRVVTHGVFPYVIELLERVQLLYGVLCGDRRLPMSNEGNGSFVRWQGRTIEQLGFVNNLLIGLATGMLAFQTKLAFDDKVSFTTVERWLAIPSIILVFFSLAFGCYVAWNRLRSFRATMQTARKRETGQRQSIEELRALSAALDKRTWKLLPVQTALFALGGLLLLVSSVLRYLG